MEKRFFTVKEANELIPFLTERLCQLRSSCVELKESHEDCSFPTQDILTKGGMPVDTEYFRLICHVRTLATEIDAAGCQLKDLDSGLIDFPTVWEGREVFLCWKLGEPRVEYWHEVDAGFAGRQPLTNGPHSFKKQSADSG